MPPYPVREPRVLRREYGRLQKFGLEQPRLQTPVRHAAEADARRPDVFADPERPAAGVAEGGAVARGRFLALMPIRWVPPVDRNWAKFWTFYENESTPLYTDHSLLWGLIRWRTLRP